MQSRVEQPGTSVNTLIVGAGQAGPATSYWLSRAGISCWNGATRWAGRGRTGGTRFA